MRIRKLLAFVPSAFRLRYTYLRRGIMMRRIRKYTVYVVYLYIDVYLPRVLVSRGANNFRTPSENLRFREQQSWNYSRYEHVFVYARFSFVFFLFAILLLNLRWCQKWWIHFRRIVEYPTARKASEDDDLNDVLIFCPTFTRTTLGRAAVITATSI